MFISSGCGVWASGWMEMYISSSSPAPCCIFLCAVVCVGWCKQPQQPTAVVVQQPRQGMYTNSCWSQCGRCNKDGSGGIECLDWSRPHAITFIFQASFNFRFSYNQHKSSHHRHHNLLRRNHGNQITAKMMIIVVMRISSSSLSP